MTPLAPKVRARRMQAAGLLIGLAVPASGIAHSFGQIYTLPVPFWLYAWGASAALLLSFVVIAVFATTRRAPAAAARSAAASWPVPTVLLMMLRAGTVAALLLCIVTGLFGTPNPYGNFNMTVFWVLFLLGYTYLTALIGNLYDWINPWRVLAEALARLWPRCRRGWLPYPRRLGHLPACVFYGALVWFELFGGGSPRGLSWALLGYTALSLAAGALFGIRDWFRYCEVSGVVLRLLAMLAPLSWQADASAPPRLRAYWRWPLTGLLGRRGATPGLLLLVLFLLSATAYDGLHETRLWVQWFWAELYPNLLVDWVGRNPLLAYPKLRDIFVYWQSAWLLLSPFIYLLAYLAAIALMRVISGPAWTFRQLALRFCHALLPIVLVYHLAHYYTLLQTQGPKALALISDPFGFGWNLFGTAHWFERTPVPDSGTVWHVQVGLILLGHVASVAVAHVEAIRCFGSRRRATLSQLPMLALMVGFTVLGLWILSQPASAL